MSSKREIDWLMLYLINRVHPSQLYLLNCVTRYPASLDSYDLFSNVSMLLRYGVGTGLSDHTIGSDLACHFAALMGATNNHVAIEKHISCSDEPHLDDKVALGLHEIESFANTCADGFDFGRKNPLKNLIETFSNNTGFLDDFSLMEVGNDLKERGNDLKGGGNIKRMKKSLQAETISEMSNGEEGKSPEAINNFRSVKGLVGPSDTVRAKKTPNQLNINWQQMSSFCDTLNKKPMQDWQSSFADFFRYDIKLSKKIFGSGKMGIADEERAHRLSTKRSLHASRDIAKNEEIELQDICFLRSGAGKPGFDFRLLRHLMQKKTKIEYLPSREDINFKNADDRDEIYRNRNKTYSSPKMKQEYLENEKSSREKRWLSEMTGSKYSKNKVLKATADILQGTSINHQNSVLETKVSKSL